MTSQTSTHTSPPRPSRRRWWPRLGVRAAALSLALALGAASSLAASPAWATGGYRVTAYIRVGNYPFGIALNPDGSRAYVANWRSASASVISTATNKVTTTIHGVCAPYNIAVSPDSSHIYVTGAMTKGVVSVITRQ